MAAAAAPEPVLLVLADISGYTRFLTANAKSLAHSQTIITELIQTLVRQAELPLEVAKLEGDAVFFVARRPSRAPGDADTAAGWGRRLLGFFDAFRATLRVLAGATTCTCGACTHLSDLRLKLIVHVGEALFHEVAGFRELAGPDVILVHRLLKNSVSAREYLLLTESARPFVTLPAGLPLHTTVERYEEFAPVQAVVHQPEGGEAPWPPAPPAPGFAVRWQWKLWQGVVAGAGRGDPPRGGPAAPVSRIRRAGLAALSLALAPVLLPVSFLRAAGRRQTAASPAKPRPGHA